MNQPRSGIRGVTLDDVSNVASRGSQAMSYPTVDPRRGGLPTTRSAPRLNAQDIIAGMTFAPLNTAKEKYSGYPTATQQELAIIGSTIPFFEIGQFARDLAAQQLAKIMEERGTAAENLISTSNQQLAEAKARLEAARGVQAQATAAGEQFARSAMSGGPIGMEFPTQAQNEIDREIADAQKAYELASYGAAMAARNKYAFAQPTYQQTPQGEYKLTTTSPEQALADTLSIGARNQPEYTRQVAPMEELAAEIAGIPRYRLAQQMATQVFGMDPALAAGTFTPELDMSYMQMQRELQNEQNLAAGINPDASIADTLLALDPSGERLARYQQELAVEAERKYAEGQRTAEEEEFDLNLEIATGIPVEVAAGDYSLSTTRAYLSDDNYMATVQGALQAMQETNVLTAEDRKRYAEQLAADYLKKTTEQEQADPVGARILLNILYDWAFTIPTRSPIS